MNDNIRDFCKRMAEAAPDRFEICKFGKGRWFIPGRNVAHDSNAVDLWTFIGPLLDELGIAALWRRPNPSTLLEAAFQAVTLELEGRAVK